MLGEPAPLALGRADARGVGRDLFEGGHTQRAESLEQCVQHIDGRASVGQGAVVGNRRGPELGGQRRELAVGDLFAAQGAARQDHGVEDLEPRPFAAQFLGRVLEEPDVKGRVVGDQNTTSRELEEAGEHLGDAWGADDHLVGYAGQHRDERGDVLVGVDQGLELTQDLAAAHLDGTELGDPGAASGRATGRLEVDNAERQIRQRSPQLIE